MPISADDAAHLLRRTGVVALADEVATLTGLTVEGAVNTVLDTSVNPPLNIAPIPAQEQWIWFQDIRRNWLDRMATLPAPIEAKLDLFWHGHFATSNRKIGDVLLMVNQYQKINTLGRGPFRNLLQAIAIDPAMLRYLDNDVNYVEGPNENWARECLELFTLGANQGYTQTDVVEHARAWTGHNTEWTDNAPLAYRFFPERHDNANKTIFGITKNWNGPEVLDEICNGSRRSVVARHLARKLWVFFAAENPDGSLLVALTAEMEAVGLNTIEFLRRMFQRPEFYSDQVKTGHVRSPIEWGAMVLKALKLTAADVGMDDACGRMGQMLFEPPTVAGWKSNGAWCNENVFWQQDQTAAWAGYKAVESGNLGSLMVDFPTTPIPQAVQSIFDLFGLRSVSAGTRQVIEKWLQEERVGNAWAQRKNILRFVSLATEARIS